MRQRPLSLVLSRALRWQLVAAMALGCTEVTPASPPLAATVVASAEPSGETSRTALTAPAPTAPPTDATSAEPVPALGARIYAKTRFAWIHPSPEDFHAWIGYVSVGGSVPLRGGSPEAARAGGKSKHCDAIYAVEPRGYVCAGSSATLDPDDPLVVALRNEAPDLSSPWPYQYAESIGAPRYRKIPDPEEQRAAEWDLQEHLGNVARARAAAPAEVGAVSKALVGVDLQLSGVAAPKLLEVDETVRAPRKWVANGSTVAYTRTFDVGDRAFVLAADHAVIPKDRVRPYARSSFQGVHLGEGADLPLAFFRKKERPKFRRGEGGSFVATGEMWAPRTWVALTGDPVKVDKDRFYPTKEDGVFVRAADASVVEKASTTPFGKKQAGEKWVDVSVLDGWLVAYEGDRAVFATLISPGRGGVPYEGRDPLETASTPTGRFRIDGKFMTATMVSSTDENLVHTEVQYVQNFHGPHALHGAYWHDAWGEPKSGGCINLSPIDSKWLFEWTEPNVPEGWYGMRAVPKFGRSTVVLVHR